MQRLPRYALKSGFGWGLGLSLALGGLGALPAQAQYKLPAPVPPPSVGALPAPIQAAPPQPVPSGLVPVNPPPANAVVAPIAPDAASKTAALTTPLLVAQWRVGKSTPQEAWDKGLLTVEDLIYILNHSIDYWGGFYWEKDVDLRREIVALLVQHGGDRIAKPETLSSFVRLWLADYYESKGDARTLPLCESILNEIKTPVKGEGALAFQAVERIGWYYRDKGQYEQGAQAWLRMMNYHADIGWWTPDAIIEAAQLFSVAGNDERAQGLYDKMPQYGDGWFTGIALCQQADNLIRKGKYHEAQKLLQRPVTGNGAQEIKVGIVLLMARVSYLMGEFESAQTYSIEALKLYNSLTPSQKSRGFIDAINKADSILQWSRGWLNSPLIMNPSTLYIIVHPQDQDHSIVRQFIISSYRTVPLNLTTDNPGVSISLLDKDEITDYCIQKRAIITISPASLKKSFDATVRVSPRQSSDTVITLPVHVEVQPLIQVSTNNVFFGTVKNGITTSTSFKLWSPTPFHILSAESSTPILKAHAEPNASMTMHTINLVLQPPIDQFCQGTIRVTTDVPTQEVIEVPFTARIK